MDLVNETPFTYAPFMGRVVYPKDTLTIIVKGTFRLKPDGAAEILPEGEQLPPTGDQYYDDDPHSSVRYESDFIHFKPGADICVVGHCHVPGATPRPVCKVSFSAGPVSKSLMVFGKRLWKQTLLGTKTVSDPEPFQSMALRYENSYGGPEYSRNPVGKGIRPKNNGDGDIPCEVPNLKVFDDGNLKTMQEGTPAGFGPLGRTWPQRMAYAGTYGRKWEKERWPWLPEDFNWRYFNAAPANQQVKGFLKGDEPLHFENMHPEHSEFASCLPGVRVRCFLSENKQDKRCFREVNTHLDTLWADMDNQILVLVWRGMATVETKACENIEHLYIVQEAAGEKPRPLEEYEQRFNERIMVPGSQKIEPEMEPGAASDPQPTDAAPQPAEDDGLDTMVKKAMTQAHADLGKTSLDPRLAASLRGETDPERFLEKLLQALDTDPAGVAGIRAAAMKKQMAALKRYRPQVERLMAEVGLDVSDLDKIAALVGELNEKESPHPAADPKILAEAARSGAGTEGMDMSGSDFSHMSLEGADFKGAQLAGANFLQARLAGADFSQADLAGAVFIGADLSGAVFTGADMSRACFSGAMLQRGDFTDALASGADLTESDLSEAILRRTQLEGANLANARMCGADLEGADMSSADMSHADLSGSGLAYAVLEGADLTGADLTGARGSFASLADCDVTEADFTDANMEDCVFSGCRCDRANFAAAVLN
ncbi:MAG: DUF2169 domain-containing protein, partial [Desulfosarcinaceae bacterium]